RNSDVRDLAIRKRRATGEINYVLNVSWSHDALVVSRNIEEELVERDILLRISSNKIVKLQAGDCQHRSTVELGIVESVEQVNSTRTGGSEAHSQFAGELGIPGRHECGRFFVAHLYKTNLLLARAQRLHDSVDPVAGKAKDRIDSPIDEGLNQNICCCHGGHLHSFLSIRMRS